MDLTPRLVKAVNNNCACERKFSVITARCAAHTIVQNYELRELWVKRLCFVLWSTAVRIQNGDGGDVPPPGDEEAQLKFLQRMADH